MSGFPTIRLLSFPLWLIRNLWGDTLRLCGYPVLIKLAPTHVSTRWLFLPESVITIFAKWWFFCFHHFSTCISSVLLQWKAFPTPLLSFRSFIYISMNSWIVMHYSMGYNPLLLLYIFTFRLSLSWTVGVFSVLWHVLFMYWALSGTRCSGSICTFTTL